jgi:hypothetical protein
MYVPPAGGAPRSVAIRPAIIKAWGAIDGDCTRMLLSDQQVGGRRGCGFDLG